MHKTLTFAVFIFFERLIAIGGHLCSSVVAFSCHFKV